MVHAEAEHEEARSSGLAVLVGHVRRRVDQRESHSTAAVTPYSAPMASTLHVHPDVGGEPDR